MPTSQDTYGDSGSGAHSRLLVRNVGLNFIGQIAPVLAAAVSMPILARTAGLERLGLLNLAWVVLGSFGLLDLGVGRALTQITAGRLVLSDHDRLGGLLVSGCAVLLMAGAIGGAALALAAPTLISRSLNMSPALHREARVALYLLAAGLPFMMTSSAARGFLEAHQRFDLVNVVRAPIGVVTYLGPVLLLPVSHSVAAAVGLIAAARVVGCGLYLLMGWSLLPPAGRSRVTPADLWHLSASGFWMTVSNVAATVMSSADRFVLGSVASMAVLAYYSTPQEVLTKITVVPATVGAVVFPAFSAAAALRSESVARLFLKMNAVCYAALAPITVTAAVMAPVWLSLWMGRDFAAHSIVAARWICLGVFANGLAITPVSLLQGAGRANVTAKLQVYELPVYAAVLWVVGTRFGITGVAMVWAARVSIDALLMYVAARSVLPPTAERRRAYRDVLITWSGFLLIVAAPTTAIASVLAVPLAVWFLMTLSSMIPAGDREALRAAVVELFSSRPRAPHTTDTRAGLR